MTEPEEMLYLARALRPFHPTAAERLTSMAIRYARLEHTLAELARDDETDSRDDTQSVVVLYPTPAAWYARPEYHQPGQDD